MPKPIDSTLSSLDWCSADESTEDPNSCTPPAVANACLTTVRGEDPEVSPAVELLTARFRLKNDQFEATVGAPPMMDAGTLGSVRLSGRLDYLSANVHLGSQNEDGSKGENVGAMATGVGLEATVEYDGWSLTAGISLSAGASISSGADRDVDQDGAPERCFQVSFGPLTLGECDEL